MQIANPLNPIPIKNPLVELTTTQRDSGSRPAPQPQKTAARASDPLSGVTGFAMSMGISELNVNQTETNLAFRKDNSLALHASSSTNIHLKMERFQFEITLSAESLGLKPAMFADPSQPLTIHLHYTQSQLAASHKLTVQNVKTIRSAQEIIQDLVEGLTQALQDPGNKSICYHLDEEAIASLVQSDQKTAKLFSELVMIMNVINLMKKQTQPRHDYVILLSGKGQPYLDVQEETIVEGFQQDYQIKMTILPPKTEPPADSPPPPSEQVENKPEA